MNETDIVKRVKKEIKINRKVINSFKDGRSYKKEVILSILKDIEKQLEK